MQLDENQISIKAELNGHIYYLVCDRTSFLGEIHDALCTFKSHIITTMQNIEKSPEPTKIEE